MKPNLLALTTTPSAQLIALCAPASWSHPLVIQSLAARTQRGESIGVVLGDNRFELYGLVRLAQQHGDDPTTLLARVEVSRAFTCHHLHRRVLSLDDTRLRRWRALYVLGLLDTFDDEAVSYSEAVRLLKETLAQLECIVAHGLPVLITIALPRQRGRVGFVGIVAQAADAYWEFARAAMQREPPSPQMAWPLAKE
jgi:hypothetical protein